MIKYILIDDEVDKSDGFIRLFTNSKKELETYFLPPQEWKIQRKYVENLIQKKDFKARGKSDIVEFRSKIGLSENERIDGIILDLRLDEKSDVDYKGNSIAQEIRNLSTEKIVLDCPLILFSAPENLDKIYKPDNTSHDLFDIKFAKHEVDRKTADDAQNKIIDLAKGYHILNKNKNIKTVLGIEKLDWIDERIIENFEGYKRRKSASHEYARFVLKEIVQKNGILINEYLLAARLGVDIVTHTDRKSWDKLKEQLSKCSYQGVFSNAWQRWWMSKISDWMRERSLGSKSPKEQVDQLNKEFGLKLKAAEKTEKSRSNDFWVICKNTNRPIALEDAVIAAKDVSSVPWEEDEYYSIDEALTVDVKEIHPMERERLKKLKKLNTLKRPKK